MTDITSENRVSHAIHKCEIWSDNLRHNAEYAGVSPSAANAMIAHANSLDDIASILEGAEYWDQITESLIERGVI